jgi:hypothetical protein
MHVPGIARQAGALRGFGARDTAGVGIQLPRTEPAVPFLPAAARPRGLKKISCRTWRLQGAC